jgi:chromosome segregation ATPase
LRAVFPALVGALALVAAGCTESTTRSDVADAQEDLKDARQETAETTREAKEEIAEARQDAQEHTVGKPVDPEDRTEAANDVADARQEAKEDIADAKADEKSAEAELKATQQDFQATQQRDAFVKDAEQKLAEYDKRIDELNTRASNAQGTDKENLDRQINTLKGQRDRAESALNDLKGADLATWKTHEEHVRTAFQDLDNSMKSIQ